MFGITIIFYSFNSIYNEIYLLQKSILIVEDDLDSARIYRIYLENQGFEVACFLSAHEALENFKIDIHYYSMVLSDFKLQDMDGIQFARIIREIKGYDILILLITAYSWDHSLKNREIENIVDKIITKPIELEKLTDLLLSYTHSIH